MWRVLRRLVTLVAVLTVVLAAGVALLASGGSYDLHRQEGVARGGSWDDGPAWTRPCWRQTDVFSRECGRVDGRVLWRQLRDPDGDGDRHLLVLADFDVHIVKLPPRAPATTPSVGTGVNATGRVSVGASGREEIVAASLR